MFCNNDLLSKLEKINYVFFDYDDTLCINHSFIMGNVEKWHNMRFSKNTDIYLDTDRFVALDAMKQFVSDCNESGKNMYVLTWDKYTNFTTLLSRKIFLDNNYGNDTFEDIIVTGTREEKISTLQKFCKIFDIGYDRILLVEDHPDTIGMARQEGFCAISVSDIVSLYQSNSADTCRL